MVHMWNMRSGVSAQIHINVDPVGEPIEVNESI